MTESAVKDGSIAQLRRLLTRIEDDFRLSVRLAAAIASVTHNKGDITMAVDKAKSHGNAGARAESLAIVVKTLAETGHFVEARFIAFDMIGLDAYWRAEAHIWIARFSGDPNDIESAEIAVSDICSHHLRNEARTDLRNLLGRRRDQVGEHSRRHHPKIKVLRKILSELEDMEDSPSIAPKHTSAFLRLKAHEIIFRLLAEAVR